MKYSFNKTNHCDFGVVEKNRYAPRAYFIPHTTFEKAKNADYKKERYESDMVTVLSGEWDFKYYKKKSKLPEVFDSSRVKFDKITVPCTWQRTGYESPEYINCPYAFDPVALGLPEKKGVTPPDLPEDFSCGVYRKFINIDDVKKNYILTFLGAVPCIDLYINGNFVGYGEAAHNSYEFDITKFLKEGENEIVAVLFKWCNGSYLEAQDMFRENGIFRDVLLYKFEKTFINDYEAIAEKTGKTYTLNVNIAIKGAVSGCSAKVSLFDGENLLVSEEKEAEKDLSFALKKLSVTEWNAELPKLYELFVTLSNKNGESMTIRSFVGFRDIKIKGTTYYFNGKKIKLKGVNHHDTHETKGYAESLDDLENDIILMKQYNVNCVRTSHYPPDPFFLSLADRYGVYLVDEADIETHGLWHLGCETDCISHNLKWAKRYCDRVRRMYYRDRSHPCIIMWSLGNESNGYKCHDKCYDMLKNEIGTKIPVHYEGVSRTKRYHYDVYSEMYTHPDELKLVKERKRGKQYTEVPFFLCEYCHAMGVGPGALKEYMEMFESDDIFMGGCIWEWADHSVRHINDGFPYEYTYGGDHGEKLHDGCFCVDGLFYPDRTPHTGALEMKALYRPLRVKKLKNNILTVKNTNKFRNSSYIEIYWQVKANGELLKCGSFMTDIDAEKEADYEIALPEIDKDKNVYLDIVYLDGDFEIAREQLTLNESPFCFPVAEPGKAVMEAENGRLTVKFDGGETVFNSKTGEMLSFIKDGVSVLNENPVSHKGFFFNLSRAYVDNDRADCERWEEHLLSDPDVQLMSFSGELMDDFAFVNAYYTVFNKKSAMFDITLLYIIGSNGVLTVEATLNPVSGNLDTVFDLPRFGLTFEADKDFKELEYFGKGPFECLCDFKAQCFNDKFTSTVEEQYEPYIRPQDNMNHCDVQYFKLKNEKGDELLVYPNNNSKEPAKFTFNVHNFTQDSLLKANHREDLRDENTTFVTVDGFTRGTGTGSCGPKTLPQYAVDASRELDFAITIVPLKKK